VGEGRVAARADRHPVRSPNRSPAMARRGPRLSTCCPRSVHERPNAGHHATTPITRRIANAQIRRHEPTHAGTGRTALASLGVKRSEVQILSARPCATMMAPRESFPRVQGTNWETKEKGVSHVHRRRSGSSDRDHHPRRRVDAARLRHPPGRAALGPTPGDADSSPPGQRITGDVVALHEALRELLNSPSTDAAVLLSPIGTDLADVQAIVDRLADTR
jgi:hypothetical protein